MVEEPAEHDLAGTLELFDRVAVNLDNLQQVWDEMTGFMHISGFVINMGDARYDELMREFEDLAASLPPIHDCVIASRPMRLDEVGHWRIDAMDVPESRLGLQLELDAPGRAIAEYRHRLQKERRGLVRRRADVLITRIDGLLKTLVGWHPVDPASLKDDEDWIALDVTFRELFRLLAKRSCAAHASGTSPALRPGRRSSRHRQPRLAGSEAPNRAGALRRARALAREDG